MTDYAWKSLEPEQHILQKVDAALVVAERGSEEELTRLSSDADGILVCWKPVTERVITNAPRCLAIGRYGIGLDNIDVRCATNLGIVVTNVPAYCVEEVSDHALALLLSLARKVAFYDGTIKDGVYDLRAGAPLFRLKGKTLGIVGFGKIGRALYRKALGFELKIIVYDPFVDAGTLHQSDIEQVGFSELLNRSDYISIHIPLTPETHHMFSLEAFRQMKRTAYVINTARGAIIDCRALLQSLEEGTINGAALDVLEDEPPSPDDQLVRHPRAVITPHAAFYSEESLLELQKTAATQMADVLSGKLPEFVVNPEVLDRPNLRAVFGR